MGKKYLFIENVAELVDFLVERVIKVSKTGNPYTFGTINFKVDGTPTRDEIDQIPVDKLTSELATSYKFAAGTYGITTIDIFNQIGIQLVFGYYGGEEGIQTVYFDDNYEIEKDEATSKIKKAIDKLLSLECQNLCRNFLVEVIDNGALSWEH